MSEPRNPILIAAAVLVALEGAAALGFGLFVGWETVAGDPQDRASAIGVTLLALVGGGVLVSVARGLLQARSWTRSPGVLAQLFSVPVAVSLIQSGQPWIGYPLIVTAVVALLILLSKPTATALYGTDTAD
ncbi:MAG: hypothetical protein ABIS86_14140 [Streptosporangiaceae bacterium]